MRQQKVRQQKERNGCTVKRKPPGLGNRVVHWDFYERGRHVAHINMT